jgi:hypothetical protein
MMATAGALLSAAVTVLAVLLGLCTMMLVGRMLGKHGVHAPDRGETGCRSVADPPGRRRGIFVIR